MKKKEKKAGRARWSALTGFLALTVLCSFAAVFQVCAGQVTAVVDNQTGDDSLQLEIAVGGVQCTVTADNGYLCSMEVPDGTVNVNARVIGDVYGYYKLEYEPVADCTGDTVIRINLNYSDYYGEEGEDYAPDLEGVTELEQWDPDTFDDGLPDTGMEEIDLSGDSADKGTLIIACEPVNAFDEVVLTLQDEDYQTYRIPLHMEPYFFRARVTLPAGKYRETGQPEITFNEYASPDESLSYVWAHTDGAAFGGFLDIGAGTETEMTDLAIRTMVGGDITVTDSRYFTAKKLYEEESLAEQEASAAFEQKNYETLPEGTLPAADTQEETEDSTLHMIIGYLKRSAPCIAAAVLLAVGAATVAAIHRKYRENNRTY